MGVNLFRLLRHDLVPRLRGGWVVAMLALQILLFFDVALPLRNAEVILMVYGRKAYYLQNQRVVDIHKGILSDGSKQSPLLDAGSMLLTFLFCAFTVIQLLRLLQMMLWTNREDK
jgi:hypothetical protein